MTGTAIVVSEPLAGEEEKPLITAPDELEPVVFRGRGHKLFIG